MTIDLEDLELRLKEYDPNASRCPKQIEEVRYFTPSGMDFEDPEVENYKVSHYVPCSRPEGHDGECRNSRRVLGWPGYAALKEMIAEIRELRERDKSHQSFWKELP